MSFEVAIFPLILYKYNIKLDGKIFDTIHQVMNKLNKNARELIEEFRGMDDISTIAARKISKILFKICFYSSTISNHLVF